MTNNEKRALAIDGRRLIFLLASSLFKLPVGAYDEIRRSKKGVICRMRRSAYAGNRIRPCTTKCTKKGQKPRKAIAVGELCLSIKSMKKPANAGVKICGCPQRCGDGSKRTKKHLRKSQVFLCLYTIYQRLGNPAKPFSISSSVGI